MRANMPILTNSDKFTRKLIFFAFILFFLTEFLAKNLEVPDYGKYVVEAIFILLYFRGIYRPRIRRVIGLKWPYIFFILIVAQILFGCILNSVPLGNLAVGLMGHYLGFSVFFVAMYVMTLKDYRSLFNLFFYYQFFNLACTLYQYFVLGYYQDLNNGAFTSGAGQDFFCGILVVYFYSAYLRGKTKLWKLLFILASSACIAVLQEEKFILFEIALVVVYQAIIGKKNVMNIFIITACLLSFSYIVAEMGTINGDYASESLSSSDKIWENLTTEGAGYGFPRFGSTLIITKIFFPNDLMKQLFGLGCGTCENTTLSIADTSFLKQYGDLNYFQYPIQLGFLQTGWTGIILYILFFVSILIYNFKCKIKAPQKIKYFYDIAINISLICIALIWYNQTLKWYYAIMPFFFLALGPVCTRQINNNEL